MSAESVFDGAVSRNSPPNDAVSCARGRLGHLQSLKYAAVRHGNVEELLELIRSEDVTTVDGVPWQSVALCEAIRYKNAEMVQGLLLQPGLDVNQKHDVQGRPQKRAPIWQGCRAPIHEAVCCGSDAILDAVMSVSEIDVNATCLAGNICQIKTEMPPLVIAVEDRFTISASVVSRLLQDPKIDVHKQVLVEVSSLEDSTGENMEATESMTALQLALWRNKREVVTSFLRHEGSRVHRERLAAKMVARFYELPQGIYDTYLESFIGQTIITPTMLQDVDYWMYREDLITLEDIAEHLQDAGEELSADILEDSKFFSCIPEWKQRTLPLVQKFLQQYGTPEDFNLDEKRPRLKKFFEKCSAFDDIDLDELLAY